MNDVRRLALMLVACSVVLFLSVAGVMVVLMRGSGPLGGGETAVVFTPAPVLALWLWLFWRLARRRSVSGR